MINVIAFIITAYDKRKSVVGRGDDRTPEGKIFFLAAAFGAIGVYMLCSSFATKPANGTSNSASLCLSYKTWF